MSSLAFPKMFFGNRVKTIKGNPEALQNYRLIILSKVKEFFGDPEYGTLLVDQLFLHNAPILENIILDNIYTTIINYIPLLKVNKDDIKVVRTGTTVSVSVKVYNNIDNKYDLFSIDLMSQDTNY